jgi:hypothetical protein
MFKSKLEKLGVQLSGRVPYPGWAKPWVPSPTPKIKNVNKRKSEATLV